MNGIIGDDTIRMVALDLDGTVLNNDRKISDRTIAAFHRAMERGVHIVICTGRVFSSLPKLLFSIDGLEYVITSNGARITRMRDQEVIYEKLIPRSVTESVIEAIRGKGYSVDAFTDGRAYIDAAEYEDMKKNGSTFRTVDYVLSTRKPVEGIFSFMEEHSDRLENISIVFEDLNEMERMRRVLSGIEQISLTRSFENNIEVGGSGTSKASALGVLMEMLGVTEHQLMAAGDSLNDIPMIRMARIGVAVGNAEEAVKAEADYVTDSNQEDGVAKVIEKFVL